MKRIEGTIWVDQVIRETGEAKEARRAWLARQEKNNLRREERETLSEWWRADEKDRPEVVRRYQDVFARVKENRQRAWQIEQSERAINDERMKALGYVVRPGRVVPRYVRPERLSLYQSPPLPTFSIDSPGAGQRRTIAASPHTTKPRLAQEER